MEGGGEEARFTVRMSVHAVVETTLHEPDLVPSSGGIDRMKQGAQAHRLRQKRQKEQGGDYRAETALSAAYEGDGIVLEVVGRADGLLTGTDGRTIVEEIKLGAPENEPVRAHRAQAACYGHMLCKEQGLPGVRLRILYVDEDGEETACFEEEMDAQALQALFEALCAPAAKEALCRERRRRERNESLRGLTFPYEQYREGQHKLARNVYIAIRKRCRLFAQAPTGIGKTMAVLYPSLLGVRDGNAARIVYLTARTTGRDSALRAAEHLIKQGAQILCTELTAKDSICPMTPRDCRPECCARAAGYYDRLPAALEEAVAARGMEALYNAERIVCTAQRYALCPFELSLELARLSDVVIGDYNYVYAPSVAAESLLAEGGAVLLADEAHQLAPRVQDAYSAQISLDELCVWRREVGKELGRTHELYKALSEAIRAMRTTAGTPEFGDGQMSVPPQQLKEALDTVAKRASEALGRGERVAPECFKNASDYVYAAERYDERYVCLTRGGEKHAQIRLYLRSAAKEILAISRRARGTVYFSATLAPFDAARLMLGSEEEDGCLMLPPAFASEQLKVRIAPIDLRYAKRQEAAPDVAKRVRRQLDGCAGHAMVFFSSYAYMETIYERLSGGEKPEGRLLLRERRNMTLQEKQELLAAFDETAAEQAVLFAVMGGAFAEGIDLPGNKLGQVIVVSVGMPQPDERIRAMQAYYDERGHDGFYLCMRVPGMVRVIQAAGRLIRTSEDRGELLLIDSRFEGRQTRELLRGTLIGAALER